MLVFFAIFASSIKLVIDTYIPNDDSSLSNPSKIVDLILTIFFTLEAIIKTIALGFILEKNSYLRESWS